MDDNVLEYSKAYHDEYKQKFNDNATEMFDGWVKESKVNVDENRKTAKEYREAKENLDNLDKRISKYKRLKGFLIFLVVLGFVATAIGALIIYGDCNNIKTSGGAYTGFGSTFWTGIIVAVVGLGLAIGMLVLINKKIKPILADANAEREKETQRAKELLDTCFDQLRPLYSLFRDSATAQLVQKTVPIIKLDTNFNMRRFDLLSGKYGLCENLEENESTVGIFSGEILGNPFIEERRLKQEWGTETYTGSLTIYWTEVETDSEGNVRTVQRSQTLYANVQKPKPYYSYFTHLVYGNEAAPDLCFTHEPSHAEKMSEKELAKKVKKGEKELAKLEKKALESGTTFNSMGNVEFDILFGATDRNHDVQFRLLFTPLAQKNMLHLMKTPQPFGDDFYLIKDHMLNFVASEHAQDWNFEIDSSDFMFYDIDMCKSAFLDFNNKYFLNLYFELAPLMSIPLYQQYKPHEYIYRDNYPRNYTSFEAEVLSNALDEDLLKHPESATRAILKTALINTDEKVDNVLVTAHSFATVDRVDYVSVYGGDGYYHDVPVPWVEYIAVEQSTPVGIVELEGDHNNDYNKSNATKHNLYVTLKD